MTPPLQQHARTTVAGILQSPAMAQLWAQHHNQKYADNPAPDLASEISSLTEQLQDRPDLLAFMLELINLERGMIRKPRKQENDEYKELREQLDGLKYHLETIADGITLPSREILPEDQQKILDLMERQTAQKPFRPVHSTLHLMKDMAIHLKEEASTHPGPFLTSTAFCGAFIAFMNMRLGDMKNNYIDPELAAVSNLTLDSLDDPDFVPEIDMSLLENFQPSCHDHLQAAFGKQAADLIKTTLDGINLFPQHCTGLKTLGAWQGNMWDVYDGWNARMAPFIQDPAEKLGDLLANAPFHDSFVSAATNTADFVYAANWHENITLHTVITYAAFRTYCKYREMEDDERKKIRQNMLDFARRTPRLYPLTYALSASASACVLAANGSPSAEMIWPAIIGGIAGHTIDRYRLKAKTHDLAKQTTLSVRESLTYFADTLDITQANKAWESPSNNIALSEKWKAAGKAALITTAAVTADAFATGGQVAGSIAGGMSVIVPFLYYNVPEDTTLHWVFGLLGAGLAATWQHGIVAPAKFMSRPFLSQPEKTEQNHEPL